MKPSTLKEWLAFIEQTDENCIRLGLDGVKVVIEDLNLEPQNCPIITVAGTNGKGSTVKALETLATLNEVKSGSFTSPHLFSFNERISINGTSVRDSQLLEAFMLIGTHPQASQLTYFEWSFLLALAVFKQTTLDLIILEVGLGGRLDATNAIDADLVIVSSIDLDHMDYLGTTRDAIGFEKAGVFRPGCPVICADPLPPQSLINHASRLNAPLFVQHRDYELAEQENKWTLSSSDFTFESKTWPQIKLSNLASALCAWHKLSFAFNEQKIASSMSLFRLAFRREWLSPQLLVDVAHNQQSISHLCSELTKINGNVFLIFSMLKNKEMDECVKLLQKKVDRWFIVPIENTRGRDIDEMKVFFNRQDGLKSQVAYYPSLKDAYLSASSQVSANDVIVICGSFLLVNEFRNLNPLVKLEKNSE